MGREYGAQREPTGHQNTVEVEGLESDSFKTISIVSPGMKSFEFLMPQLHPQSPEDKLKSGLC